ncbi:PAS domain S-box protein [Roseivirga sp. BDSF3-8]|uniref:PAS domain S-box protein n=1 Tax=Roseivirga sp. BDSF3-8 TaxID=3241598 RepID=UPI003532367F
MPTLPFRIIKKTSYNELLNDHTLLKNQIEVAGDFIKEIEKGNLDVAFGNEDEGGNESRNYLAEALLSLRKRMVDVSVEEKQRTWVSEHRSKFIDILRSRNVDLDELADDIIGSLVKYLSANQGALYVVNDDNKNDTYIEMLACYAYNRKKYLNLRIENGSGLVGQAILEKETTYLSEIPDNYINITSGLGAAPPKYLLIVPLKLDDTVFGALEIASFTAFKPYQIEFTEQLGESIASTIANTKNNQRTRTLLEHTQQQTEELRAQEEEVRQNMEELQATQEEMQRKSIELESRMVAIDESGIASIEFDLEGYIKSANQNFLKLMGYTMEELKGKHHRIFVSPQYAVSEEYRLFWHSLGGGESQIGEYERFNKAGESVFIQGSYSILKDNAGRPEGVLKLAADITSSKVVQRELTLKAREIESRLKAIDESGIASIEFDLKGNIRNANQNFLKLMGYELEEIRGRHHALFVTEEYAASDEYRQFWADLASGRAQTGEYQRYGRGGKPVYIQGSYSILYDSEGNPNGILKLAADITSTKKAEEEVSRQANEATSRLKAIDESGIASIEFDLEGNIRNANQNFLKLMGYELEEIRGHHHAIFVGKEYAATEEYRQFWADLGSGKAQMGEYERYDKKGNSVYIQGSYSMLYNSDGKPGGVLKLAADITAVKMAQAKMEEQAEIMAGQEQSMRKNMEEISENQEKQTVEVKKARQQIQHLTGMLDACPDTIFVVNAENEITEGNKACRALCEKVSDEPVKDPAALYPGLKAPLTKGIENARAGKETEKTCTANGENYLLSFSTLENEAVAVCVRQLNASVLNDTAG